MSDAVGSKIRIMLVDDNPTFLRVATAFLQRHDDLLVVGAVEGGEEALAQLLDIQPHVVLLDLAMPGLSGMETIPRLRAAMPHLGIVVLTMLDDSAYRQAVLAAGADGYVRKASMYTDLLPAIRQVVSATLSI